MARKTQDAPAFPGGLMRLFGRGLLVCVVVCLGFTPSRGEAAIIVETSPGMFSFSGELTTDDEVVFFPLSFSAPTVLTAEVTSSLCVDPTGCDSLDLGFEPILTLLLNEQGTLTRVLDSTSAPLSHLLDPGKDYLLALSQYENYFTDGLGFQYEGVPNFTKLIFAPSEFDECEAFITPSTTLEPECRDNRFAGTYGVQSVAEPGTLSLLALGGTALGVRLRKRSWRTSVP